MLSLDAALLHGLRSLGHGYWPVVATLLDRPSLNTITALPYATKPLARGKFCWWFDCSCLRWCIHIFFVIIVIIIIIIIMIIIMNEKRLAPPSLLLLTCFPSLPYTGRSWICLCLNEGQLENYIHVLTSHTGLLAAHYEGHGLLRDPHRAHLLLMLAAGLEHLKFAIPMVRHGSIQLFPNSIPIPTHPNRHFCQALCYPFLTYFINSTQYISSCESIL